MLFHWTDTAWGITVSLLVPCNNSCLERTFVLEAIHSRWECVTWFIFARLPMEKGTWSYFKVAGKRLTSCKLLGQEEGCFFKRLSICRLSQFGTIKYCIGGQNYSADDIEHGILRGNKPTAASLSVLLGHPEWSKGYFKKTDPRLKQVTNNLKQITNWVELTQKGSLSAWTAAFLDNPDLMYLMMSRDCIACHPSYDSSYLIQAAHSCMQL